MDFPFLGLLGDTGLLGPCQVTILAPPVRLGAHVFKLQLVEQKLAGLWLYHGGDETFSDPLPQRGR